MVKEAFEAAAGPNVKYVSHEIRHGLLSITYQVEGYNPRPKSCAEIDGRNLEDVVRQIAKDDSLIELFQP